MMRKFKIISLIFLIIFFTEKVFSEFKISEIELYFLPGALFTNTFFENISPETTLLIEESNGISILDYTPIYFQGIPWKEFNFSIDEFSNSSFLFPGKRLTYIPLSVKNSITLYDEASNKFFIGAEEKISSKNSLIISSALPELGENVPFRETFLNPHPDSRSLYLSDERRRYGGNIFLDFSYKFETPASITTFAFNFVNFSRYFNEFSTFPYSIYEEKNNGISLFLSKKAKNYNLLSVLNYIERDNYLSEFRRLEDETLKLYLFSFLSGLKYKNISITFSLESENRNPQNDVLLKSIYDIDGEGIFFEERIGKYRATALNISWEKTLKNKNFSFLLKPELTFYYFYGDPDFYKTVKYLDDKANLYEILHYEGGNTFSNKRTKSSINSLFSLKISKKTNLYLKSSLIYESLFFKDSYNNLSRNAFSLSLLLKTKIKKNIQMSFSFGRISDPLTTELNFFLEKNMGYKEIYYSDGTYKGISGVITEVDKNLKYPYHTFINAKIQYSPDKNLEIGLKGIIKYFKNRLWIYYNDSYGYYNDNGVYILNSPISGYTLSNYKFEEEPFYKELLFYIQTHKPENYHFRFSFMAHIGMGYTSFGNGIENDISYLSFTMASPNTWINGFGRVDGDRAFIGKLYFLKYILKNLILSFTIKYRDGDPFAFISYERYGNEILMYYKTIIAEDRYGVKGGPREDYLSDVSLKLSYIKKFSNKKLLLSLEIFNVLDIGAELSENVLDDSGRYSIEKQLPRSMRFSLRYIF